MINAVVGRLDFNPPPTAVGGISGGWARTLVGLLTILRLPSDVLESIIPSAAFNSQSKRCSDLYFLKSRCFAHQPGGLGTF
jgi:hypothetical protein